MATVNRSKLNEHLMAEQQQFIDDHPQSRALYEKAKINLLDGVPMPWMTEWPSPEREQCQSLNSE